MKLLRTSSTNQGSLLIEVAIALGIMSIIFMAFTTLLLSRQRFFINTITYRQALFLAKSTLARYVSNSHPTAYATTSDNILESFSVTPLTPCLNTLSSEASWNTSGIFKKVSFSAFNPDLTTAKGIDGDCEGTYPSFIATSTLINRIFSIPGTTTAIDVLNSIVYVTSTVNGTSTLFIYKNNNNTLTQLSSLELPTETAHIDATHNNVFIAGANPQQQFQIVDTTDLAHPKLKTAFSLPGVAGSFPGGKSIFYFNHKVYIGTHRTAGNELHVFDVSTEPATFLGSLELNHNINAITVREPYVYLATSGNTKDFIVVDATNPHVMKMIASLDIPGSEDVTSMFVIGNSALLGRNKSLYAGEPDFITISLDNPLNPQNATSSIMQSDIAGIHQANSTFFLIAGTTTSSLVIKDKNLQTLQTMALSEKYIDSDFENKTHYTLLEHSLILTTFSQ